MVILNIPATVITVHHDKLGPHPAPPLYSSIVAVYDYPSPPDRPKAHKWRYLTMVWMLILFFYALLQFILVCLGRSTTEIVLDWTRVLFTTMILFPLGIIFVVISYKCTYNVAILVAASYFMPSLVFICLVFVFPNDINTTNKLCFTVQTNSATIISCSISCYRLVLAIAIIDLLLLTVFIGTRMVAFFCRSKVDRNGPCRLPEYV
jgi:hypothetical protein